MLNFQLTNAVGLGERVPLSEIQKSDAETGAFLLDNPQFIAIRFDATSAAYAGQTVLMNKREIISVTKH